MMKYLLLFALLAVLWWRWKKNKVRAAAPVVEQHQSLSENMLVCAHCGVYLPASEALFEAGQSYCCPAHQQAAHPADGR